MTENLLDAVDDTNQLQSVIVDFDDTAIKDTNLKIDHLIDTLVEKNKKDEFKDGTLEDLIDILINKEEQEISEKEEEERLIELEKKELEDLTAEEIFEMEELQEKEQEIFDAELTFRTDLLNQLTLIDEKLINNQIEIVEYLDKITVQNEISNNADHVISIYGMIVFPAILIFLFFMKILSRYF